jgi:choline dehydrogenase-like flavoprotein
VLTRPPERLQLHQINPYDIKGREVRAQAVFTLTPAAQERYETLNFSTFAIGLYPAPSLAEDSGEPSVSAAQVADLMRRFGPRARSVMDFLMISEGGPVRDSRVRLSSGTDELGVPRVELDWRHSPLDRHTIQTGLELLGRELGRLGLGRMLVERDGVGPMEAGIDVGSHHMGTARMSLDPTTGVVDSDCKVHGIDNLFVAGSAVYTTGGCANPTLTLLALALRLADHLDERVLT